MGEAKRRAATPATIVYHHTSTLRTNLIWMSGVIELEGNSKGAFHPKLGEIQTDVKARRECLDFPPLAWFSSSIRIPRCLMDADFQMRDRNGKPIAVDLLNGISSRAIANGIALNRVAIGFPVEGSGIVPWREHRGYSTPEGQELNDTARQVGDDPDMWYVSDQPVDVLTSTEIWVSRTKYQPKLERQIDYLQDVHRMVKACRENEGVYIPPSWLTPEQAQALVQSVNMRR